MNLDLLVVDDEPGIRYSVKRALRDFRVTIPDHDTISFTLSEAESAEAALEKIAEQPFDLILLDHKLGKMTGLEMLRELKKAGCEADVVMVTAFATIEMAVRATKSGAYDFLAKPFSPQELRAKISKASEHILYKRRAHQLADEKRRVRFEFIRVLGHELKSPLAAVESYLMLMDRRAAGDTLDHYGRVIERCLARTAGMRKLIVDLLDMTRIEAGEKARKLVVVDLGERARLILDDLEEGAKARNISLSIETEGDVAIAADPGEMEIVLNNLLSNAVKYNREGGAVHLLLTGDETKVVVAVRDTGIGLEPQEAAKLFSDFVRIKNKDTRAIEGSGLGLSIVKKIAALYDGDVWVKSERGVGSTFTATLRRVDEAEETDVAKTSGGSTA